MLENRTELLGRLDDDESFGNVFARHAYGMLRWVDLFAERIPTVSEPDPKELVARLVADNARHMNMFRGRARAHGVDPDAYRAPAEGEVIYDRLAEIDGLDELAGYALGSLEHFEELLGAYAERAAAGADADVIAAVRADVAGMRAELLPLAVAGRRRTAEAHELYRVRELVEVGSYGRG